MDNFHGTKSVEYNMNSAETRLTVLLAGRD